MTALLAPCLCLAAGIAAAELPAESCPRPAPGSTVPEPADLRSRNGILKLDLAIHNHRESDGSVRYCYVLGDGRQSPTLRLHPGDLLILKLRNELSAEATGSTQTRGSGDPCRSGAMTAVSTN